MDTRLWCVPPNSLEVALPATSNFYRRRGCGFVGRALYARSKLEERQIHSLPWGNGDTLRGSLFRLPLVSRRMRIGRCGSRDRLVLSGQVLLDPVQLLLYAVLAASQRPIAEHEPYDQTGREHEADHEPAHLFQVLAHIARCLLDVSERCSKSLYRLPLDLGALLPHGSLNRLDSLALEIGPRTLQLCPLGLELLDGGVSPLLQLHGCVDGPLL